MPEINFGEAALRHSRDAEILHEKRRSSNSDQLYGLSAECALKEIMVTLGAEITSHGDLVDRSQRKHIDTLWTEFQAFAAGRKGARYLSPLSSFGHNPFSDWSIEHRYGPDSNAPSGSAIVEHIKACRACLVALQRAKE